MSRALLAIALAAEAPITAREPGPTWDLSYAPVVELEPDDPGLMSRFPCPRGSEARRLPIIDCGDDEVCPTRAVACWDGGVLDGPVVAWAGTRKISEAVYVEGLMSGPYAGWWPDGSLRALGRVEAGHEVGARHHWSADGTRQTTQEEHGLTRTWTVGPQGWLLSQSARDPKDPHGFSPEPWTQRLWWPDGTPRSVLIDVDAEGVQAFWDPNGQVLSAARMHRARPTGPAYVRVGQDYAVERWRDGHFLDVSLPPGEPAPPTEGAGIVCPAGAFWSQRAWVETTETRCATLSGYDLGPSRTVRPDGSVASEALYDADGPVSSTGWCRDGTVWTHAERGRPEATVSGSCPLGAY